jgi:hypothetical protein
MTQAIDAEDFGDSARSAFGTGLAAVGSIAQGFA